jgi:hypothetical protein
MMVKVYRSGLRNLVRGVKLENKLISFLPANLGLIGYKHKAFKVKRSRQFK